MSVLRRTKQAQVFLQKESEMIDFKTIAIGDKVKVVGAGAPGFAALGDELEITNVLNDRVFARRADGKEAFFALTCGAARLELTPNALHEGPARGD